MKKELMENISVLIIIVLMISSCLVYSITSDHFVVGAESFDDVYASSASDNKFQSSIHYSTVSALADVQRVISTRDNATNISISAAMNGQWFLSTNNYNQTTCNNMLYSYYGIEASGTCTLVSMLSIINFAKTSEYYSINNSITDSKIFEQLYAIAVARECQYLPSLSEYSSLGTKVDQIDDILHAFYMQYGILTETYNRSLSKANENGVNIERPSVMTIYKFSDYNKGNTTTYTAYEDGAHSVVCNGLYKYNTTYKRKPWYALYGISTSQCFDVFVINNGWRSGSASSIGDTNQLLVFDDDATVYIAGITGMLDTILS